jgi:hypothetical protein
MAATTGSSDHAQSSGEERPLRPSSRPQREEISRTAVAAFVGIVVALILSPLTQSLSFFLSEYLARPLLSIEFVEVVPEEAPTSLPPSEIKEFVQSSAFRSLLMSGNQSAASVMSFQDRDSCSSSELKSLKSAVDLLVRAVIRRSAELLAFEHAMSGTPTDRQVREVAQKFSAQSAMMFAAVPDPKVIQRSLGPQIDAELAAVKDGSNAIRRLQTHLNRVPPRTAGTIWLKLSIANRGSSDGLVRNTGRLIILPDTMGLPISRSNGPAPPRANPAMLGVPVNVLNSVPAEIRAASVGRVEKHSFAEFWYNVDDTATTRPIREMLWRQFHGQGSQDARLVLVDLDNHRLVYPIHVFVTSQNRVDGSARN